MNYHAMDLVIICHGLGYYMPWTRLLYAMDSVIICHGLGYYNAMDSVIIMPWTRLL